MKRLTLSFVRSCTPFVRSCIPRDELYLAVLLSIPVKNGRDNSWPIRCHGVDVCSRADSYDSLCSLAFMDECDSIRLDDMVRLWKALPPHSHVSFSAQVSTYLRTSTSLNFSLAVVLASHCARKSHEIKAIFMLILDLRARYFVTIKISRDRFFSKVGNNFEFSPFLTLSVRTPRPV